MQFFSQLILPSFYELDWSEIQVFPFPNNISILEAEKINTFAKTQFCDNLLSSVFTARHLKLYCVAYQPHSLEEEFFCLFVLLCLV